MEPETITAAPAGAQIIGWGDFDNDGSDELLIGWPAIICKRTGDGKWISVGVCPALKRSANIRIVDSNRDGLADIVSAEASGVTVFWNETALPWVRHVIAQGFRNQSAAAGNFAGAGKIDVISGDIENDRKIQLFRAPDWKPTLLRSGIRVIQSAALGYRRRWAGGLHRRPIPAGPAFLARESQEPGGRSLAVPPDRRFHQGRHRRRARNRARPISTATDGPNCSP